MRTVLFVLLASVMIAPGVGAQEPAPAATAPASTASDQVVAKIIAREKEEMKTIRQYSPLVETYVQQVKSDPTQGWEPNGDRCFIGRAEFANGLSLKTLDPRQTGSVHEALSYMSAFFSFTTAFAPRGFLQ